MKLSEKSSTLSRQNSNGQTALHKAVGLGLVCAVATILSKDTSSVKIKDKMGRTPLHAALQNRWGSERNTVTILELLVDSGASLHQADGLGETPLVTECAKGQEHVVRFILRECPDILTRDETGKMVLEKVVRAGHHQIAQLLLPAGSNSNATYSKRNTALHIAAENGHKLIVAELLRYGASKYCINEAGKTPLMLARKKGHAQMWRVFERLGHDSEGWGKLTLNHSYNSSMEEHVGDEWPEFLFVGGG